MMSYQDALSSRQVMSSGDLDLTDEEELRIAFDFDGVPVTDESETI